MSTLKSTFGENFGFALRKDHSLFSCFCCPKGHRLNRKGRVIVSVIVTLIIATVELVFFLDDTNEAPIIALTRQSKTCGLCTKAISLAKESSGWIPHCSQWNPGPATQAGLTDDIPTGCDQSVTFRAQCTHNLDLGFCVPQQCQDCGGKTPECLDPLLPKGSAILASKVTSGSVSGTLSQEKHEEWCKEYIGEDGVLMTTEEALEKAWKVMVVLACTIPANFV